MGLLEVEAEPCVEKVSEDRVTLREHKVILDEPDCVFSGKREPDLFKVTAT